MPTSRTINATVTALVSSYRKEIQAAARDANLSKAEERKLSPWLKSHVQQLRQGNKPVTVDAAVKALKPVIERAARSIAGADGKIDAKDVQKLRVADLRTHAATLFDTTVGPSTSGALERALTTASKNELLSDFGWGFEFDTYSERETPESIVAKLVDVSKDDLGALRDFGAVKSGVTAVRDLTADLKATADEFRDNRETAAEQRQVDEQFGAVSRAAINYFKPETFQKLLSVRHSIEEDGDTNRFILLGQKKDGSWAAMQVTEFPF